MKKNRYANHLHLIVDNSGKADAGDRALIGMTLVALAMVITAPFIAATIASWIFSLPE